jgi:hypothetical protein
VSLFVRVLVVVVTLAVVVASPTEASALFRSSNRTVTATFTTTTLQTPQALTAKANSAILGCGNTISWTNPQPGVVTSWTLQRYIGANTDGVAVTIPGASTSYVDTTSLTLLTTYTWKLWARSGSAWISATSASASLFVVACV